MTLLHVPEQFDRVAPLRGTSAGADHRAPKSPSALQCGARWDWKSDEARWKEGGERLQNQNLCKHVELRRVSYSACVRPKGHGRLMQLRIKDITSSSIVASSISCNNCL